MNGIKQYERKYIIDELCVTCQKRVYIHCDYTHNRAAEPQCTIGKTLKQAYLKGSEDADIFHSEHHEQQLQELTDRAVEAFCHVKCFGSRESRCADCLSLKVFTQKLTEKQ